MEKIKQIQNRLRKISNLDSFNELEEKLSENYEDILYEFFGEKNDVYFEDFIYKYPAEKILNMLKDSYNFNESFEELTDKKIENSSAILIKKLFRNFMKEQHKKDF